MLLTNEPHHEVRERATRSFARSVSFISSPPACLLPFASGSPLSRRCAARDVLSCTMMRAGNWVVITAIIIIIGARHRTGINCKPSDDESEFSFPSSPPPPVSHSNGRIATGLPPSHDGMLISIRL